MAVRAAGPPARQVASLSPQSGLPWVHSQPSTNRWQHTPNLSPSRLKNTFSREQFLCETGLGVPLLHPQFIFMQRFQTH